MPSENGGGGTSRRICAPAAMATKDSSPQAIGLRTAELDSPLHLAQPHGLEQLQPLPDDRGEVQEHGLADLGMRSEVRSQRGAGERDNLGIERRGGGEREAVRRDQRR